LRDTSKSFTVILLSHAVDTCGKTVFLNDFDQYPGAPANYTEQMIMADFPAGKKRAAGTGDIVPSGLVSAGGFGRAYVGDKVLRITQPEGAVIFCPQHLCPNPTPAQSPGLANCKYV
jgi:hypothetical protein